jgi:hypothetical protein
VRDSEEQLKSVQLVERSTGSKTPGPQTWGFGIGASSSTESECEEFYLARTLRVFFLFQEEFDDLIHCRKARFAIPIEERIIVAVVDLSADVRGYGLELLRIEIELPFMLELDFKHFDQFPIRNSIYCD